MSKRKVVIEPVMEEERRAIQLLCTPAKSIASPRAAKTPTSLVKRMSRVSLSEHKNWSVSKTDGTKLLLKRAILADKTEKDSPKKTPRTPKTSASETPKSTKKLTKTNIEEILSMELKENSDEELPTLIIRQHVATTPKRKQSISKTNDLTPKKALVFDEEQISPYTTRSGRVAKNKISYLEEEVSPIKRTPRRTRKTSVSDEEFKPAPKIPVVWIEEAKTQDTPVKSTPRRTRKNSQSDDEFKPVPKTPKTPRTPKTSRTPAQTPKQRVSRKIISQLTPTLHTRAHSVDNIAGKK